MQSTAERHNNKQQGGVKMKKLNNKGFMEFAVLAPYIIGVGYAAVATGLVTTDYKLESFRERKALEYCQADGIANCEAYVSGMSKSEVLAYIKDTQENPR